MREGGRPMSDRSAVPEESLPLSLELRIDAVCRAFEAAWKATADGGTEPRIEDHLAAAEEPERWPLLHELLKLELHYRRGEPPSADEFRRRFPEYGPQLGPFLDGLQRAAATADSAAESVAGHDPFSTTPELPPGEPPRRAATPGGGGLPCIPGYEVLGVLGRGGMGVVYKARHLALNRVVALKMILSGTQASVELRDRFRREAELVARVPHPNIVQIHEVGEHDGHPFCALELVGGGSLKDKLAGTPLPPQEAARLVETLARAMHAAHQEE